MAGSKMQSAIKGAFPLIEMFAVEKNPVHTTMSAAYEAMPSDTAKFRAKLSGSGACCARFALKRNTGFSTQCHDAAAKTYTTGSEITASATVSMPGKSETSSCNSGQWYR